MLAQYYKDENIIRIFSDRNSGKIADIKKEERRKFGFPPFSKWKKTIWGYEIYFRFVVTDAK